MPLVVSGYKTKIPTKKRINTYKKNCLQTRKSIKRAASNTSINQLQQTAAAAAEATTTTIIT